MEYAHYHRLILPIRRLEDLNELFRSGIVGKRPQTLAGSSRLVLMGIEPTYPSAKYGYIIPEDKNTVSSVSVFKEKPTEEVAREYIEKGRDPQGRPPLPLLPVPLSRHAGKPPPAQWPETYLCGMAPRIHGTGIEPDIVCELDSEAYYVDGVDNQLERAKEEIDKMIKYSSFLPSQLYSSRSPYLSSVYTISPFGRIALAISTTTGRLPPGLPRRSRIIPFAPRKLGQRVRDSGGSR